MDEKDIEQLSKIHKNLLQEMIKEKTNETQNYIKVTGYPHKENLISNILAFYFDVNGEHELNDLFISSLIKVYNEKKKINIDYNNYKMYAEPRREFLTDKGNRIDIFIDGIYPIIIENKIFAGLNNDLGDYYNSIEKYINNNSNTYKEVISIVLSLNSLATGDDRFVNITYDELFDEIYKNCGKYFIYANNKWVLFLKEFINNIIELKDGKNMKNDFNNKYNNWLKDNEELAKILYKIIDNDESSKRDILFEIKNILNEEYGEKFSVYQSQNSRLKTLWAYISKNACLECFWEKNNFLIVAHYDKGCDPKIAEFIKKEHEEYVGDFKWNNAYLISKDDMSDFEQEKLVKIIKEKLNILLALKSKI